MALYDITPQSTALEFDTSNNLDNSSQKIDDTHFINFWAGDGNTGFAQVFYVDPSTKAVTKIGTALNMGLTARFFSSAKIDNTHFVCFFTETSTGDGFAQVFYVNPSTYAVTKIGSGIEFDTADASYISCAKVVDDYHFIAFWRGPSSDGFTRVFEVNPSTYNITAKATALEFDTAQGDFNSCDIIDSTHIINFWSSTSYSAYAQVFEINSSTFAVTALGTRYNFSASLEKMAIKIDGSHFLLSWRNGGRDWLRVFEVNLSTYAVTAIGSEYEVHTFIGMTPYAIFTNLCPIGNNNIMLFCGSGDDTGGFTKLLSINPSTYTLTAKGTLLKFDTYDANFISSNFISSDYAIVFWRGSSGDDGFAQVFYAEIPSAPTTTTQAVSNIKQKEATGNGNITDTGGVNPHLRGIAYMPASSGDISFIHLPNPSFEDSTLVWGGAGTLARSSEQAKYGTYSMKVTWASGSEAYGEVHPTPATYSGKKITFSAWVWSSVANIACLNIYDNAGAGYEAVQSAYHPGDSTWRLLTVSKTLRSGLTDLILRCRIVTGSANSAYFDGVLSPYSDSVSPTLSIDSGNYSTGAFTKALTGLTPNTDYRAVAFAQNSVGVGNGSTVGFTTLKAGDGNFFQLF